jgi:hypothetical protein
VQWGGQLRLRALFGAAVALTNAESTNSNALRHALPPAHRGLLRLRLPPLLLLLRLLLRRRLLPPLLLSLLWLLPWLLLWLLSLHLLPLRVLQLPPPIIAARAALQWDNNG